MPIRLFMYNCRYVNCPLQAGHPLEHQQSLTIYPIIHSNHDHSSINVRLVLLERITHDRKIVHASLKLQKSLWISAPVNTKCLQYSLKREVHNFLSSQSMSTKGQGHLLVADFHLKATSRILCELFTSELHASKTHFKSAADIVTIEQIAIQLPLRAGLVRADTAYLASYQVSATLESTTNSTSRGFCPSKGFIMCCTTSSCALAALSLGPSRITSSCTCHRRAQAVRAARHK